MSPLSYLRVHVSALRLVLHELEEVSVLVREALRTLHRAQVHVLHRVLLQGEGSIQILIKKAEF